MKHVLRENLALILASIFITISLALPGWTSLSGTMANSIQKSKTHTTMMSDSGTAETIAPVTPGESR